jgi:hypothetical protein
VVVTPGPLLLDTPISSTKPAAAHKKQHSEHISGGFFSQLSSPSTGITAEKLSANKAAKRAASIPVNAPHSYQLVGGKKSSLSYIPVSSKLKSTSAKKPSTPAPASVIAARSARVRDLVSPSYQRSTKASLAMSYIPPPSASKVKGVLSKESNGVETMMLDGISLASESQYDDISGLTTPYTVASNLSMDIGDDRVRGRMLSTQSFGGSLSPVNKVSEDPSWDSASYPFVPQLSSEEVISRLPSTSHNRILTSHIRQMQDRPVIEAATAEAVTPTIDSSKAAGLIHRIMSACSNEEAEEEEQSSSPVLETKTTRSHRRMLPDCDISSVDPSRW